MIYLKTGVGIELRGEDMLLSALQSNFSKATFTCFARIEDYLQLNREELRGKISQFFQGNNLGKESVVLGIPRDEIVFRHLEFPPEVKDNLKEVVRYQVQAFEPSEENGFYHDYMLCGGQPLQPGQQGQKQRLAVFVAMVRKAYLDEQLGLLRECGIRPAVVTCGSMGLANLWLQARKGLGGKTYFLADAGKSSLELFALRNGQFAYSHAAAKTDSQGWGDLLLAEMNEAVSRLRLGGELEKIILAGESAAELFQDVRERVPDCELLDKSVVPFEVPEKNSPFLAEAAASVGLAFTGRAAHPVVGLNLLPPALVRRQGLWGVAVAAVLGVVILSLVAGLWLREPVQDRRLLSQLKEENQKLEASVRKVRSLEAQGQTLQTQEKLLEDIVGDRDRNLDILRELTTTLPTNTFLKSYTNRNGVIQMSGESGSSSDLIPQLEKSPLLKDVVQRGSITKNQTTGRDLFTFEAKLEK
jgi:Tfp pilus assembly protein PilN